MLKNHQASSSQRPTLTSNECIVDSLHLMVFQTLFNHNIPIWDYSKLETDFSAIRLPVYNIDNRVSPKAVRCSTGAVKAWLYKGLSYVIDSSFRKSLSCSIGTKACRYTITTHTHTHPQTDAHCILCLRGLAHVVPSMLMSVSLWLFLVLCSVLHIRMHCLRK